MEPQFPVATPVKRASDYTPIEWLDMVLETLAIRTSDGKVHFTNDHFTYRNLYNTLSTNRKNPIHLDDPELFAIIDKLAEDKFINKQGLDVSTWVISLTFLGLLHLQKGGYLELYRKEKAQIFLQLVQTNVICVGTGIAGIYYLLEMIKWIASAFSHHCN